jgi:hypothetical protein
MLLEQKNSRLQGFIMPPYTQKEIAGFKMSGDELRSCLKQLYQSYNKQFPEGATQVQWERFTRKHLNEWFYADEVHEPKHLFNLWHHQSDQKKDLPLNPIGPTGLRGLGCLPHWGANRCVYPMIEIKNQVTHENFWIVVENQIKDEWGFPEGDENDRLGTLRDMSLCEEILFKQVFKEGVLIKEALSSFSDEIYPLINAIRQPVVNQAPKQIYKGYVDDPRNTDNAWVDGMFLHWTIILTEQQIALLRKILERANEPERVKLAKIEEINYSIHGQIYLS